jgi:hypothetical protein
MRVYLRVLAAAACLTAAGCGGVIDPSKNTVETFAGTIDVGGLELAAEFNSGNGEYDVRFTDIVPAVQYLGLAWGRVLNGTCQIQYNVDFAQVNRSALLGAVSSGRYCVFVYDWGTLTGPVTYTIRVSRP